MPLIYTLKKVAVVRRDIYRPVELQGAIKESTGLEFSLQTIYSWLSKDPDRITIRHAQAICTTLNCRMSEFLDVTPEVEQRDDTASTTQTQPSEPRPGLQGLSMPDPFEFD